MVSMQPPKHKGPQPSIHYSGFGWAKGNTNQSPQKQPPPQQQNNNNNNNRPTAFSLAVQNSTVKFNPNQAIQAKNVNNSPHPGQSPNVQRQSSYSAQNNFGNHV